jgi:hypothetical protein
MEPFQRLTDHKKSAPVTSWRARDIRIVLDDDLTYGDVATVEIRTPAGAVKVMAVVAFESDCLMLSGLHIQAASGSRFSFGHANLRRLADAVMEDLGCDEIRIEGAPRTTGSNPGRRQILRFARRVLAAVEQDGPE